MEKKSVNKKGARAYRQRPRLTTKLVKKGILKRLLARTFHPHVQRIKSNSCILFKRPACARLQKKTRTAGGSKDITIRKKPAANLKNNGLWLWMGVVVGKYNRVLTHPDGTKRVTYRLLPRKADAKKGTPRGFEEIRDTLQSRIAKGSFLVRDGWSSTDAAIKALGFKSAPAVVHENAYRDVKTGFHTNDAESENSRVKGWNRVRYGQLRLNKGEMDEYVYYVNIGRSFSQVAKGLAISNGGVVKNKILK